MILLLGAFLLFSNLDLYDIWGDEIFTFPKGDSYSEVLVGVLYDVYFVVTALDLLGNESGYSNEVTKNYFIPIPTTSMPTTTTTIDDVPPEDPYNLIISMMFWQYKTIKLGLDRGA